ncbi:CBS domain-containing protein, partial [Rhizobium ruizarguesonis]
AVPHTRDREDALADYVKARSWRVKDVMSTPVISAAPTATACQLSELLQAHDIKHLPVVENGRLAGSGALPWNIEKRSHKVAT